MTVPRRAHDVRSLLHDWRVGAEADRGPAGSPGPHETPFVGREGQLRRFQQIVANARASDGLVVTLSGEAGIGKSRLLRELARRGELLGLDVRWTDDREPGSELAEPHGSDRPRLIMLDASATLDRLPQAGALAFPGGRRGPVVTFLALPQAIGAEGLPARRLLATLARQHALVEMPVPPLADAELFELTRHLLGGPPNARLHETISSLSEGNPFLAEELALDLIGLGLIAEERGTRYLLGDVPATYVPDRVAATLGFELDAVDPDILQTLSYAAVLGAGFRFEVLAAALNGSGDRLLLHLEAGLAHGILREAAEPPDDFQFNHELMRRVLYHRLSGIRRRRLHQAVAEVLERQPPPADPGDRSAVLAYHFTRGVDRERALAHILRAQERAEHLMAWDDAIRYCREGLDLARQFDASVDLQLDLLERLGALYFGRGQTFATGACWREALQVCEQAGDAGSALRKAALAARLAALGPSWCSIEAAESTLAEALGRSPAVAPDEAAWRFDAYHELGLAHQRGGRLGEAVRYFELALGTADPTDWPRRALVRVSLAGALITAGRPAEAASLTREALGLLEAEAREQLVHRHQINYLRDPRRIHYRALGELVRALACLGELDEASRLVGAAHDEEIEFGMLGGRALRLTAQVELARRRPAEALHVLETRLRQHATGTLSAVRVADLLLLAQAQLMHGDANLAFETATDGIHLCQRSSTHEHLAGLLVVMAGVLLERQEIDLALETAAEAREIAEQTGANLYRAGAAEVEAACRAARAGAAAHAASRARDQARRDPLPALPLVGGGLGGGLPSAGESSPTSGRMLTAREREVLALMADGRTNRQIAEQLVLSDKTVKRHLSNIFVKLGVNSRAAAVRSAFQSGLL
jgi:DNA-binding CsgD family transcriptional regulator/tetratricopeptide (TPR) repeat protein